jgi:hypothetical protein
MVNKLSSEIGGAGNPKWFNVYGVLSYKTGLASDGGSGSFFLHATNKIITAIIDVTTVVYFILVVLEKRVIDE